MRSDTQLNWRQAARVYWYHLLPLPLFAPFVCYTIKSAGVKGWSIALVAAVFFPTVFFAQWPYMRGRVGRSYQHLVGLLYVVGGFLLYSLCELVLGLIRS